MSDFLPADFVYKDLVRLIDNKENLWNFLFETGLLGWWQDDACSKCTKGKIRLRKDNSYPRDGGCWRCTNKECGWKFSLRSGSWFSKSKLRLEQILDITYQWVNDCPNNFMCREVGISKVTTVDWKNFCREVCENLMIEEQGQIGGPGHTIEIDESKFGKRKYNRGRMLDGKWVFGGICRETKECFFEVVEKRDTNTLLPILTKHVRAGSTIYSDCWAAYNNIDQLEGMNYKHDTVNHSKNFVDPESGCHTQRIESTWHALKAHNFPTSGTRKPLYPGYFAEYCIRKKYLDAAPNKFGRFLDLVKRVYTPHKPEDKEN